MILKKSTGTAPKNLKFLIINPFGIGDVLFTTPVIKALKQQYPDALIGYWSNFRVSPILGNNPQIDKIFALSRGDLKKIFQESFFKGIWSAVKLTWQIKKEHFDICLDFSLDHRYSLFAKIIGIRQRIGFNYKGRGIFLTKCIDLIGYQNRHIVEYYLELLKLVNIPVADKSLYVNVSAQSQNKALDLLTAAGIQDNDLIVGIVPGAGGSWGKDSVYKHWPALKFAQVADMLAGEFKAKIVILGDESEGKIAEVIRHVMHNKPIDFTGKTDLEILPALIKNCNLLITNDGGPMHIAAALGVRTVSIFGPVSELVYGPFPCSNKHVVLKWDMSCRPCYNNFRLSPCDKDRECLKSVSVDSVFNAAVTLLV